MNNKYLICVVGPTAIGKTALGIELAKSFQTEILSADSRQFFREMHIGTAVPNEEELSAVPHHFIQHKSIEEPYSVGNFERDALKKSESLFSKHNQLILVGGSGLYVDAVVNGLDDFPTVDPAIRETLNKTLKEKGIEPLQEKLKQLDPAYFLQVDKNNPQRLTRALEICIGTGKPFSTFREQKKAARPFKTIYIGLTADRELIYSRINERVDKMMRDGLLEEARNLYSKRHLNGLNTVGYKELFRYLGGSCNLKDAVSEIKKNTRRFAKRQLTWYRKNPEINWFDYSTPASTITEFLQDEMENDLKR